MLLLVGVAVGSGLFLGVPLALDSLGAVLVELAILLLDLFLAALCLSASTGTVAQGRVSYMCLRERVSCGAVAICQWLSPAG